MRGLMEFLNIVLTIYAHCGLNAWVPHVYK